ncbi:hypothetical protein ACSZM7_20385 [Aeromonas veronii]
MEEAMKNYLPAIDIMMCHLGISFEQACDNWVLASRSNRRWISCSNSRAKPTKPSRYWIS